MGVDDTTVTWAPWEADKVEVCIDGRPIGKPVAEGEARIITDWLPTALADLKYFIEEGKADETNG